MTIDDFAIWMANAFTELKDDLRSEMRTGFDTLDRRMTRIEHYQEQHAVEIKTLFLESGRTNARVGELETEVFGTLYENGRG